MVSDRARAYIQSRAELQMDFTVVVERVTPASYDETTLIATAGERSVLYSGKARIWEASGASQLVIADGEYDIQSTQISFPAGAPLFRKNDEIGVTAAPGDQALVGKRFQIQSSAKAGALRPTRRYAVTVVN